MTGAVIVGAAVGRRSTGIEIRPDRRYAHMWRIRWPDGRISSMGNLARAKDAALAYAHPGGGKVARWHGRQIDPDASQAGVWALAVPEPAEARRAAAAAH